MAATPFHFGDSGRALYGVYHHAEQRSSRAPAVLLLNPFGEEAVRGFRLYKILAERLARAGAPSLRFDYYGTGDSAGRCEEADFAGMVRDTLVAQEELAAMSAKRRFAWVGLGLGGGVAGAAATHGGVALSQLFLWDAVVNGKRYLADLREAHISFLAANLDQPERAIRKRFNVSPVEMREALGFAVSDALSSQVSDFDFAQVELPRVAETHFISARGGQNDPSLAVLAQEQTSTVHHFQGDVAPWNSDEALNAYYVPVATIDYIVKVIESRI
jgi:alpha/beta superfamily hydrolase